MVRHIRTLFAGLVLAALVITPSTALAGTKIDSFNSAGSPPVVDILLMRPLGALGLLGSVALYIPAVAVTALVRPSELDVPYRYLVQKPVKFVFKDPLGSH